MTRLIGLIRSKMKPSRTSKTYIWQNKTWPNFTWDQEKISKILSIAKASQAYITTQSALFDPADEAEFFIEEALSTSAIEGEHLDKSSVRSSVAKRLGIPTAGLKKGTAKSDALVDILLDATQNFLAPLTHKRLYSWHKSLFPSVNTEMFTIKAGAYRKGPEPMQVVSGPLGDEKIHYLAPPSKDVKSEMDRLLLWIGEEDSSIDPIIKSAIAHFWFVTIHPFEDGNGRIARVISDMILAKEEKRGKRLYSLSSQIIKNRKSYYDVLESTQKSSGEITQWIYWYVSMFIKSIEDSKKLIEKSLFIAKFYKIHADKNFNPRQWKVLKKLLEHLPDDFIGGLTNKKYVSITSTSPETAKRDLKELLEKGILLQNEGKGRSTSYRLNKEL